MKVYVITTGCYSDSGIYGIYSTKEIADKVMEKITDPDKWVEEWDLDEHDKEKEINILYEVYISENGSDYINQNTRFKENTMSSYNGCYYITLCAKDVKTALKIARERHAMFLANNLYKEGKTINYFTKEELNECK